MFYLTLYLFNKSFKYSTFNADLKTWMYSANIYLYMASRNGESNHFKWILTWNIASKVLLCTEIYAFWSSINIVAGISRFQN